MREIKFRAFHRKYKVVLPVWVIDFQFQRLQMWNDTSEDSNNAWDSFNDVELMQYTGLKDKNGKEIYEGDIVEVMDLICIVEWGEYRWFFREIQKQDIGFSGICMKIIGNIYENPELMEVK